MVLKKQKDVVDEIKREISEANDANESQQKVLKYMKVFIADEIVLIFAQNDKFFIFSTKGQ